MSRTVLGQREEKTDASPDEKQPGQHPEQERRLTDRQPRDLRAIEEEARAPETAVIVDLGDLAADGLRGIFGRPAGGVGVRDDLPASRPIWMESHAVSLEGSR